MSGGGESVATRTGVYYAGWIADGERQSCWSTTVICASPAVHHHLLALPVNVQLYLPPSILETRPRDTTLGQCKIILH